MSSADVASTADWIAGARPRTLPAAIAPVLAGTATAVHAGGSHPVLALLALVVALALQVGVNYANDYSDGIRGTDTDRVGPLRLVGSGTVPAATVKRAALLSFAVAALAGLIIVAVTGQWWMIAVGAICIAAAWFYTGGKNPYGYAGLGEVAVFVFFGLVAVCGTTYIQTGFVDLATFSASIAIGSMACAILVANNLRDLDGDTAAGKRTLATRLGDEDTRRLFLGLAMLSALALLGTAAATSWWALLALLSLLTLVPATANVLSGAKGTQLIAVLARTGTAELRAAGGLLVGLLAANGG